MNKQALLGLYTLATLVALLGLVAVLGDFSSKLYGYRIGVRFPSALGLHTGALVYESGVIVGNVAEVAVLPDYNTEIIIQIHSNIDIPSTAGFLIIQPLTGDPTLRIYPHPLGVKRATVLVALPHRVLPIAEQPMGTSPLTLDEFLANSQEQVARIDTILQQLQERGPGLLDDLDTTLKNANHLVLSAKMSLAQITTDTHRSLGSVTESTTSLTAQLSQSLATASAEMLDATAHLDQSAKRGQPHIEHIFVALDKASKSLAASVDAIHAITADPALRENVLKSTRSFADTATTFAALLGDLRQVTGNTTTQAELRDAVAHIDAATQRANSFLGRFGQSSVPGVDYRVTPTPDGGGLDSVVPGSLQSPSLTPTPIPTSLSPRHARVTPHQRFVGFAVRESELAPLRYTSGGQPLRSPLLGADRGPQTDLSLLALPDAPSSLLVGANDIGANSSWTLAAIHHVGSAYYGEGILYSRIGILGGIHAGPVGVEAKVYDPRRGSVDLYGNLNPTASTTIFAGERDLTRETRRPVYGIDLHF